MRGAQLRAAAGWGRAACCSSTVAVAEPGAKCFPFWESPSMDVWTLRKQPSLFPVAAEVCRHLDSELREARELRIAFFGSTFAVVFCASKWKLEALWHVNYETVLFSCFYCLRCLLVLPCLRIEQTLPERVCSGQGAVLMTPSKVTAWAESPASRSSPSNRGTWHQCDLCTAGQDEVQHPSFGCCTWCVKLQDL